MAKFGKCTKCQLLLNWPENVNIEQMQCPCGHKLVSSDYGDVQRLPVKWYGRVVPVTGQIGLYTLAEANYIGDDRRRRKRR